MPSRSNTKRVRFLTHVMGLPGPEAVYHAGRVAEIPKELVAVIEAAIRERYDGDEWMVEYTGPAERCPGCGNDFVPGRPIIEHRTWYHGESLAQVAAERKNARKPKGDDDLVCIDCRRTFPDETKLRQHRACIHLDDRRSGTGPP